MASEGSKTAIIPVDLVLEAGSKMSTDRANGQEDRIVSEMIRGLPTTFFYVASWES